MNIYLNLKESCPKDWGNYSIRIAPSGKNITLKTKNLDKNTALIGAQIQQTV